MFSFILGVLRIFISYMILFSRTHSGGENLFFASRGEIVKKEAERAARVKKLSSFMLIPYFKLASRNYCTLPISAN
jgi:hypothetical protein